MIVSMPSFTSEYIGLPIDEWGWNRSGYNYIVVPEGMKPAEIEKRLESFVAKYYSEKDDGKRIYHLQPLADIHFNEVYEANPTGLPGANKSNLIVLGLLGAFILLSCLHQLYQSEHCPWR